MWEPLDWTFSRTSLATYTPEISGAAGVQVADAAQFPQIDQAGGAVECAIRLRLRRVGLAGWNSRDETCSVTPVVAGVGKYRCDMGLDWKSA